MTLLAESREVVRLEVPGRPVPLARPRVTGRGTYLPARSREFRERCRVAWLEAGRPMFEGHVQLAAVFRYERPRAHYRGGRVRPDAPPFPGRADLDNLVKAVLDALQGCLFTDDALVVSLAAVKVWGDPPGTVVTVRRVGG